MAPTAMRRLMHEIASLQNEPKEGIRIQTDEANMLDVTGIIEGPEGTPYSGGYFKVKFEFTQQFPNVPPKCRMLTKIFHPNVSSAGEICVNTLKKDWKPTYGIEHILTTIKCLLIYPNAESALDEEAGKLLLEGYDEFCSRARLITSVHARGRPAEFADAGSSTAAAVPTKPAASASTVSSSSSATPVPIIEIKMAPSVPAPRVISSSHSASVENEPSAGTIHITKSILSKDTVRHPSPAPLGPAGGNMGLGTDSSLANAASGASGSESGSVVQEMKVIKAVKRTAPAPSATTAQQRKKALKRL